MAVHDLSLAPLRSLPDSIRSTVAAHAVLRQLRDGEALFDQGDEAVACYAVVTGSVRFSKRAPDTHQIVMSFQSPDVWFGETSLIDGQTRQLRVSAVGRTEVLQIEKSEFNTLMLDAAFAHEVLRWTCAKLRSSVKQSFDALALPLKTRLARQLLALGDSHGIVEGERIRLGVKLSQDDLAHMVGATRQRINQLLREWQATKLIDIEYRTIILVNITGLQALD